MREGKKKDIRVCDSKKKYKKLDKICFDIWSIYGNIEIE